MKRFVGHGEIRKTLQLYVVRKKDSEQVIRVMKT